MHKRRVIINDKIIMYHLGKMWNQEIDDEPFYIYKNYSPSFERHWHDCFELELVLSGSCNEVINGKSIPVGVGDIVLVTPNDLHSLSQLEDLTIYSIMFSRDIIDTEILNTLLLQNDKIIWSHFDRENLEYVVTLLDYAYNEYCEKKEFYDRFVINAINQLLFMIMRDSKFEYSKQNSPVQTAILYIQMHFKSNPSLKEVAGVANLDTAYFSVKFHDFVGVTFKQYLNDIKIKYSAKQLLQTTKSIAVISYESGYESISQFHREFKKKYNCSPMKYRKEFENRDTY